MKRVLACGGRDFNDASYVDYVLDYANQKFGVACLIHGGARGADTLAARWAKRAGIPTEAYPADWVRLGRAAGHIRNQHMLASGKPEVVIAFPGGPGTADMVRRARAAGLTVHEVKP